MLELLHLIPLNKPAGPASALPAAPAWLDYCQHCLVANTAFDQEVDWYQWYLLSIFNH